MTAPITPSQGGHTPTPWDLDGLYVVARVPHKGASIADCGKSPILDRGTKAANAAFIVEAVNSHATLKARIEELTAALQMFIAWDDGSHEEPPHTWHDKAMAAARAALASGGAK